MRQDLNSSTSIWAGNRPEWTSRLVDRFRGLGSFIRQLRCHNRCGECNVSKFGRAGLRVASQIRSPNAGHIMDHGF